MNFKDVDQVKLSKLLSQLIDHITCLECCKYYIAPKTAACGHTLCHLCWTKRRKCPCCAKPIERLKLKPNRALQNLTEHTHTLGEAFEKLFNVKIDELLIDTGELESESDPTKNVNDWLASSQNHFSAPVPSCDPITEEIQQPNLLNVSSNKIQIHTTTQKIKSPEKVVHVHTHPQDDWDKIELMPDTEDIKKNKENIVGPMDIEPFHLDDDKEYTLSKPRRSSRKREGQHIDINNKMIKNNSLEKQSSKDSSEEVDKKSSKIKQNWNNVKRMRKEFSKLNKKNRNKLNVSIEMCKKTQSTSKTNILPLAACPKVYEIDENTPDNFNIDRQMINVPEEHVNENKNNESKSNSCKTIPECSVIESLQKPVNNEEFNKDNNIETVSSSKPALKNVHNVTEETVKLPFYKRSALHRNCVEADNVKTITHNVDSSTAVNDDIEITIKVGNTITNILIKNKNHVKLKVNTDREIQTSLDPHDVNGKAPASQKATQNIVINLGDNQRVDVKNPSKDVLRPGDLKLVPTSVKTVSVKKNTDSADTATTQFEITESVEKEMSKVMECVEEPIQSKSTPTVEDKTSQNNKTNKPATNSDNLEYLNDLDLFDSESVKESDVKLLKHTEHAHSEILLCTVKTKNKTQKHTEKRNRDINDEDVLPKSKKARSGDKSMKAANDTEQQRSNQNIVESESMNFDNVMGTVFANIDADIEEIRQSQTIGKNTMLNNHKEIKTTQNVNKDTQVEVITGTNEINSSVQINEYCNQIDSENVFSACIEKENEKINVAPTEKVPPPNIEDFLTPVMGHRIESTGEALRTENDIEMINDDSDKSVVEETPQKTTSFSKLKQKSNGANKEANQSQLIELSEQRLVSNKKTSVSPKKSIVNLTDTSDEIRSSYNITAIEAIDRKTMETPVTINKFVDHIQHKSTPYARKSLNFESENIVDLDPEHTLCPTNEAVAKTTQEKEIMSKAFEKTPASPAVRPLGSKNLGLKNKKFKIAGSCLTTGEIAKLKQLCTQYKWTYTDKYSKDLTHLVVAVDEEDKSQRSVKYMCALASSIWIISYAWVEKCLQLKDVVSEQYFEVLDSTGEPGPMRSRLASKKLFQGMTFFCMEPFSVLDVDTLKGILEAAGGRVVNEVKDVKVTNENSAPAILLAEPENTQEDRFIYLAMELSIVPVNYEWVLNCLGSYTLSSIQELLLCPGALLPKATEKWPQELLARDEE